MSREAFLEIIPIREIQEFLFDSRDPSRNMEPIQTMLAFLSKPGAYHSSQSVFTIRQDPQEAKLEFTITVNWRREDGNTERQQEQQSVDAVAGQ